MPQKTESVDSEVQVENKVKRFISIVLSIIMVTALFSGCSEEEKVSFNYPFEIIEAKEKISAEIQLENGGIIELELYPEIAPITVSNFKYLCDKGFYDGLIFHRVIEDFMIQGGCPDGIGTGGPGYEIKGEFSSNGVENDLTHERGVISMARGDDPDSAGSQFFIMHKGYESLDGQYAAFGRVTNGMEYVDEIAVSETDIDDKPLKDIKIKTIIIKE